MMPLGLPRLGRLALGAALITGCSGERDAGANSPGQDRSLRAVGVAAVEVRPRDLERTLTLTGPVEPIRLVSVNAMAAGTVLDVRVEEGARVRAGQVLAELDSREVSAQLERARAVLANAEAAFQRAEQLSARELASGAELDAARAAYVTARADAELWKTRLDFTRITAPVAGVVTAKRVERGGAVSANQPMVEIADDASLVVRVRVSELDVVSLRVGRAVELGIDAYPDSRIGGRIRRIFPSADAASRLVPVEVVLERIPSGIAVKPGFLARVELTLERRDGVLAVPTAAVAVTDGAPFVYVVQADTLVRRKVVTGLTASGWIEVQQGLAAGERVVSSGHTNLRIGSRVRVSEDRL
jgi:RND family efflux transporter MFP subunit